MNNDFLDEAEAHTKAKHQILQEYLKGWVPILARGQSNRLLYFDGFAGCGELTGSHPGSPILAIRTAMQAQSALKVPFEVRMVEKDAERCTYLRSIVECERGELGSLGNSIQIHEPVCGECETEVKALLEDYEGKQRVLGPAFFFLDQYGYSGFSMGLVRRILAHEKCETFAYLNWQRMHPYLTDVTKAETFTHALGGDEWREVQSLQGQNRVDRFKAIYVDALHTRAGAKYVYDFAMRGPDHRLIYWLFFCTNNLKGLEVMKKAMWKVDPSGRFEFSDHDLGQGMLTGYTQTMLANDLNQRLQGRQLTNEELKEYVLVHTPDCRYVDAIKILKSRGHLRQHRRGSKTIYDFCVPTNMVDLFGQ